MTNPQWLEIPISRKISMVTKMFEPLKFEFNVYDKLKLYNKRQHGSSLRWTLKSISDKLKFLSVLIKRNDFCLGRQACNSQIHTPVGKMFA